MRTSCYDAVSAIPTRVGEIRLLIMQAKNVEDSNEAFYDALCRATSVLMAAQLEGFIKDFYKAVITDFNYFVHDFKNQPSAMQRDFCRRIAYFDGLPNADLEKRIKTLIEFFSRNSVPIEPFSFIYKESQNKNPGADAIDAIFAKLGIPDVVASLAGGYFEDIFKNDSHTSYRILRECIRSRSLIYAFPYRQMPTRYGFTYNRKKDPIIGLWHTFLEGLMRRRHTIAHGDTVANVTTWEELASDTNKLEVLMHAIAYSACGYLRKP